jgi:uncharacterized membrane protein YtjA (UPF0391 family)
LGVRCFFGTASERDLFLPLSDQGIHWARELVVTGWVEEDAMMYWAAVFFVLALVAGVFGFTGLAAGAAGIARILFVAFLVLSVVALISNRRPIMTR